MYFHECRYCGKKYQSRWFRPGFCSKEHFLFWVGLNATIHGYHRLISPYIYLNYADLYYRDWDDYNFKISNRKCRVDEFF